MLADAADDDAPEDEELLLELLCDTELLALLATDELDDAALLELLCDVELLELLLLVLLELLCALELAIELDVLDACAAAESEPPPPHATALIHMQTISKYL